MSCLSQTRSRRRCSHTAPVCRVPGGKGRRHVIDLVPWRVFHSAHGGVDRGGTDTDSAAGRASVCSRPPRGPGMDPPCSRCVAADISGGFWSACGGGFARIDLSFPIASGAPSSSSSSSSRHADPPPPPAGGSAVTVSTGGSVRPTRHRNSSTWATSAPSTLAMVGRGPPHRLDLAAL